MTSRGMVRTNELMDVFSEHCTLRIDGMCKHDEKLLDHCIGEKKYCPRVHIQQKKDLPLWKTDHKIYMQEHDKIFDAVIMSETFIRPLELRYPKIDIRATLKENARTYWRVKDKGYKRKCKTDTRDIDWPETYKNAIIRSARSGFAIKKRSTYW